MSFFKDLPDEAWKAIATCGIWFGAGAIAFAASSSPKTDLADIAGVAAFATVLVWVFSR